MVHNGNYDAWTVNALEADRRAKLRCAERAADMSRAAGFHHAAQVHEATAARLRLNAEQVKPDGQNLFHCEKGEC